MPFTVILWCVSFFKNPISISISTNFRALCFCYRYTYDLKRCFGLISKTALYFQFLAQKVFSPKKIRCAFYFVSRSKVLVPIILFLRIPHLLLYYFLQVIPRHPIIRLEPGVLDILEPEVQLIGMFVFIKPLRY